MTSNPPYTKKEYAEFKRLVLMEESLRQMDRIISRLEMPKFIDRVGREKCDLMFEELKKESA